MKILIAGDFAPCARLAKQIEERKFSEVFSEDIREVIKSADFSFVNFESPVVEEGYKPIHKCGPNLRCTTEAAEAVRYAGFTGVTMANNHILDFGSDGLRKSVKCCQEQGLDVVGVGENLRDAEKVLYLEKEGKKLAIINCCEHEFSIATESEAGANPLNPIRQYYAIQEAKKQADYVLVIVHGGHEHFQLPSPRMQETYRFFVDSGADAVVNHHQHCYSGYEVYNGKPIFYGLGNFCFDEERGRNSTWNEGYMVVLSFDKQKITYEMIPYIQCNDKASVLIVKDRTHYNESIEKSNAIIQDSKKLKKEVDKYYRTTAFGMLLMHQPYENRILNKLYRMHLLPSLVSRKKYLMLLNYINCEAHHDKHVFALKNLFDKQ
mgnify:CR=1 FL=1